MLSRNQLSSHPSWTHAAAAAAAAVFTHTGSHPANTQWHHTAALAAGMYSLHVAKLLQLQTTQPDRTTNNEMRVCGPHLNQVT
jgi:hypothetical protein